MIRYAKIEDPVSKACVVGIGGDADYYQTCGMQLMDVELSESGTWYLAGFMPVSNDLQIQKARREAAYRAEVDPITAHIVRLRDMEPASEEIPELVEQRAQKVDEIRIRYPYPEGVE